MNVANLTPSELVDFLINEVSEDATLAFIAAISCFGIDDREDAVCALEKDADALEWVKFTASKIPKPYLAKPETK